MLFRSADAKKQAMGDTTAKKQRKKGADKAMAKVYRKLKKKKEKGEKLTKEEKKQYKEAKKAKKAAKKEKKAAKKAKKAAPPPPSDRVQHTCANCRKTGTGTGFDQCARCKVYLSNFLRDDIHSDG